MGSDSARRRTGSAPRGDHRRGDRGARRPRKTSKRAGSGSGDRRCQPGGHECHRVIRLDRQLDRGHPLGSPPLADRRCSRFRCRCSLKVRRLDLMSRFPGIDDIGHGGGVDRSTAVQHPPRRARSACPCPPLRGVEIPVDPGGPPGGAGRREDQPDVAARTLAVRWFVPGADGAEVARRTARSEPSAGIGVLPHEHRRRHRRVDPFLLVLPPGSFGTEVAGEDQWSPEDRGALGHVGCRLQPELLGQPELDAVTVVPFTGDAQVGAARDLVPPSRRLRRDELDRRPGVGTHREAEAFATPVRLPEQQLETSGCREPQRQRRGVTRSGTPSSIVEFRAPPPHSAVDGT